MPTPFDRKAFFDAVRPIFMHLTDAQVAGCEALLAEAERRQIEDPRLVAYMLATVFWETARTMQPIRESGLGRGKAYGVADPLTRQIYYGRGLVQLTWKTNYAKMAAICDVDLVGDPDRALTLDVAVKILFEGMARGSFTGKRLADFIHDDAADYVGARRIINGTDHAADIASYARHFEAALRPRPAADAPAPARPPAATDPPALRPASPPTLWSRLKQIIGIAQ